MEIAQTADYALQVLDILHAEDGKTIIELAAALGVSRSVAQRVLMTLHQRTMVIKADDRRYYLGPALIQLAANLPHPLAAVGLRAVEELGARTGETVVLAIPVVDEALVIASWPGRIGQLRVEYETGFRHPLVKGASGLAILAFLEEADRRSIAGPDLEETLERVRTENVARTAGQLREHMIGFAAPIRHGERVLGSIAIIAPVTREEALDSFADALQESARKIERAWKETFSASEANGGRR